VWTGGGPVCRPGRQVVPEPGKALLEVQSVVQCTIKCIQTWASLKLCWAEAGRLGRQGPVVGKIARGKLLGPGWRWAGMDLARGVLYPREGHPGIREAGAGDDQEGGLDGQGTQMVKTAWGEVAGQRGIGTACVCQWSWGEEVVRSDSGQSKKEMAGLACIAGKCAMPRAVAGQKG